MPPPAVLLTVEQAKPVETLVRLDLPSRGTLSFQILSSCRFCQEVAALAPCSTAFNSSPGIGAAMRKPVKMSKVLDIEEGATEPLVSNKPQCSCSYAANLRVPSRNSLALGVIALIIAWLLLPGLTCLGSAAWGVVYWLTHSPAQWAVPLAAGASSEDLRVPKILHQTWKSRDIPDKWRAAQQSCLDLHPDYEYRLWTDAESLTFIEEHYPWFLPTYLAYPYQIQRVDAIRYFILYHYGGIYMDLDMGCRKRIDFMRQYNFTAPLTHPGGISNDVLAAVPGDKYLERVIGQLRLWNRWMFIKYIQVMFSTGPMQLTTQYALFGNKRDMAVITPADYGKYDKSGEPYFYHLHGSSWHADDAAFIFWLDRHKTLLVVLGVVLVVTLVCGYWLRCLLAKMRKTRTF